MKHVASVMQKQISGCCVERNCCVGLVWDPDISNVGEVVNCFTRRVRKVKIHHV